MIGLATISRKAGFRIVSLSDMPFRQPMIRKQNLIKVPGCPSFLNLLHNRIQKKGLIEKRTSKLKCGYRLPGRHDLARHFKNRTICCRCILRK